MACALVPLRLSIDVASVLLDALRGVAALLVCIDHWRYLLFIDYPQLTLHRRLFFLPYAMCTITALLAGESRWQPDPRNISP